MRTREEIEAEISELEDSISCAEHDEEQDGDAPGLDNMRCNLTDLREELKNLGDGNLQALKQSLQAAYQERSDAFREKSDFVTAEEKKLADEVEKRFGKRVRDAEADVKAKTRLVEAETARLAASNPLIGRRVQRPKYQRFGREVESWIPGILELRTHDTKIADNLKHSIPEVGQIFVRLLKADGTPSLKVDRYVDSWWKFVEGE